MKIINVDQRSEDWKITRWGKVGGSSSKGLLKPTDDLFIEILSQHLEDYEDEDDFTSSSAEYGKLYEPLAREYLIEKTGVQFKEFGWLQSSENRLIGISPDGVSEDFKEACELKCLQRKAHTKILNSDAIPLEYIPQCIHYFHVIESLEKLHFFAYRYQSNHFHRILTRESIVNIGTESKPVNISVNEAVDIAKKNAQILLNRIDEKIKLVSF